MTLHREGHKIIIGCTIAFVVINALLFYYFQTPVWLKYSVLVITSVFYFLVLQFFRYPNRTLTYDDKYIVAPCDGKVVVIEKTVESEFYKDERMMVSIFMSPINVHANWYPIGGIIRLAKYHAGKYLVAWHPKSSIENERTTIVIEKDTKRTILCRQIAGALARRIVFYPRQNDIVKQCSELGFIKFGSRMDIYMPADTKILVGLEQKTTGGVTIIGEFR